MEEKPQPDAPLVEAADVGIARPRSNQLIVSHVNWKVVAGEFWVVGGSQGSGKTSFVSTLAGLWRPAAGVVRHFGEDLAELSEQQLLRLRTRVGFVFKGGGRMLAELTVAESVALPLYYHRDWSDEQAGERVNAVLRATELESVADSMAQNLRWGWQQRIGVARALALNPEVLFLDEPLSGLDARDRNWWRKFLESLWQGSPLTDGRKMTLVAVTNDFGLWSGGEHKRGLLRAGRWEEIGEHQEVVEIA
jgi:phospholipid/cholesterol/gamma-HCH transport system ATP-binding protein